MTKVHTLFSWIGNNDLKDINKNTEFGAILSIYLTNPELTRMILLSNRDNLEINEYVAWLKEKLKKKKEVLMAQKFNINYELDKETIKMMLLNIGSH